MILTITVKLHVQVENPGNVSTPRIGNVLAKAAADLLDEQLRDFYNSDPLPVAVEFGLPRGSFVELAPAVVV